MPSARYRLRYRAKNYNGWGPYSDISYYVTASKPNAPPAPVYMSSNATSTTLKFLSPINDGGSPILGFKLYVDIIQLNSNYRLVYQGNSS